MDENQTHQNSKPPIPNAPSTGAYTYKLTQDPNLLQLKIIIPLIPTLPKKPTTNITYKLIIMNNIIQWNIDGFYKRNIDIQRILYDLQPQMLCFQETNLKPGQTSQLKNYSGYFKNRTNATRASGGVATFIKNDIQSHQVNLQTHLEAVAVIANFQTQICVCNIYLPDSINFNIQDLTDILSQLPKPFIIVGDFNSRNP